MLDMIVSAAVGAQQWRTVLRIVRLGQEQKIRMSVESLTAGVESGILACAEPNASAAGPRWEEALRLLCMLRDHGIDPSERTYEAAIRACTEAGRLEDALTALADSAGPGGRSTE
jgi:hypothetical protein